MQGMPDIGVALTEPEEVAPSELEAPLSGFTYRDEMGNDVELDEATQLWLVAEIRRRFERFEAAKSHVRRRWTRTEKAVKGVVSEITKDRFYGLVPYGKQSVQTLLAHFWGRSLQTPKVFFSVRGEDEQSQDMAPIHQANLMRHCDKDRLRQKFDNNLLLNGLPKGVMLFFVGYAKSCRTLHGQAGLVDKWGGEVTDTSPDGQYQDIEQKVFEGATVKVISPWDFVFDPDNHEEWDSCFKAWRSWWVYEDIAADPGLSNHEDLRDIAHEQASSVKKRTSLSFRRKSTKDPSGVDETGRIEIIEFHGDLRLKDGTYLRNWTVVVGGNRKIMRFERNPYFINPFHKWVYEDTEDGWGVSPIDYILPFIDAGSIMLSSGVEAAKMAINPPWLAAESHFEQRRHFVTEGGIIKYRPNTTAPNTPPTPIQFKFDAPFPYVQLFEGQAEATTGATRQLSGNVTTNDKVQTATEFQGLQVVGNLIVDRVVDLFNLDCKIPVIQKIALINAMFNPEERSIPFDKEDGTREFKQVTAQSYFGNYEYSIEDNKSEMERKNNLNEKLKLFFEGMQHPLIAQRAKALDLWKELWRDFGYGQPGKYVMDDHEYVTFQANQMAIQQFIQMKAGQALQRLAAEEGVVLNAPVEGDPTAGEGTPGLPGQPPANPADAGTGGGMEPVP